MARTLIEFHCNDCNGWFIVNHNLSWDGDFLFVCPKCGREHPRHVSKGVMNDNRYEVRTIGGKTVPFNISRNASTASERIMPTMSAYSKEPRLEKVIQPGGSRLLAERWTEKASQES